MRIWPIYKAHFYSFGVSISTHFMNIWGWFTSILNNNSHQSFGHFYAGFLPQIYVQILQILTIISEPFHR